MHAVFFGLKRAFHRSLALTRPLLARFDFTPARFDMLYAIHRFQYGLPQSALRRILGVTAPTVSRMLRSLEDLGFVVRARPSAGDMRQRIVTLTMEGLRRVRRVIRLALNSGLLALAVDSALADRWYDEGDSFHETDTLVSALARMRTAYRDQADLYYPWHPDD